MKKTLYTVFVIHTVLILFVLWSDVTSPGEDWSWGLAFFIDFPLSILLQGILGFIEDHYLRSASLANPYKVVVASQFIMYVFIGGAWWLGIVMLVRKLVVKLKSLNLISRNDGS